MSLMDLSAQAAVRDQSPLDAREDILVYATPPLERPVTVIARHPQALGRLICSGDGLHRQADRRPSRRPGSEPELRHYSHQLHRGIQRSEPMEPGTPYELTIRLSPTGIRFGEGHRIRLDVASSDFPNFDRNHNTGADFWSGLGVARGAPDRLPRPRAPFAPAALGGVEAPTRRSC